MASKRKSTTPCMIPLKTLALESGTELANEFKEKRSKDEPLQILPDVMDSTTEMLSNGHQNLDGMKFFCKYCNFGSHETSPFVEHMNSKHNDFRQDPAYVCIACSFLVKDPKELEAHNVDCHPGDSDLSWTVAKHESYTVVEQSVGGHNTDQDVSVDRTEERVDDYSDIAITKTPIMKIMKSKLETKKIITIKDNANHVSEDLEKRSRLMPKNVSVSANKVTNNIVNSSHIVNGSIIGTVPVLQTGVTQLVAINPPHSVIQPKLPAPVLHKQSVVHKHQNQQLPTAKSLPKVMIPLSSIPTYNSSMDSNCFLKNNFNKFPYPTKAELCYLTVVTKYPEEQIKIWFTAQRLKQGISWSPEEIEDSRKKMFNTIIQSIPQPMPQPTITVLNAPLVANASNVQHLIQAALPGQIVSQPQGAGGLIVTRPIITNGIQGTTTSVSLTVTPIHTSHITTEAGTASSSGKIVDSSQPVTTTSPSMLSPNAYDPIVSRCKKSRQQLGALKNSFCKSQFPSHGEVARLTRITGLSTRDVRKWFSDKRYHFRNKPASYLADSNEQVTDLQSDTMYTMLKEQDADFELPTSGHTPSHAPRRQSWNQAPDFTPTRYKERAPEQLKALESSFAENTFPSEEEVNRLRSETKMTRREIDGWFSEKRKKVAEEHKRDYLQYEEDGENSADEMENCVVKVPDDFESFVENSSPMSERKVNPIKINLKALRVTESGDNTESSKDNGMGSDGGSRPSTPQKRQSCKKTAQQRDCLKQMFVKTQWPSVDVYDNLVEQTGLPRTDIVRWFGDCRYSYKNGNLKWYDSYKKVFDDIKPQYQQPLLDYYSLHKTIYDKDINDLCEKTGMSSDDIKAWFAEKLEEDKLGASDEGSDVPQVNCPESSGKPKEATHDGFSEVPQDTECGEPNVQEDHADSRSSQQSIAQLESE
ncbi:zinc fingers and homeoboxes protein 3 [Mixophyes fleayi]|uniref:zinc fingers and homeoboxes protein 3 n=1 Tax=Mixophyes fleayi TaxID=3061075 RepID=UPI003F4E1F96